MPRHTDTRDRLLTAGLDLIRAGSYAATSVDQICTAANVRKGSFYHFFASKAELGAACFDHGFCQAKDQLDRVFSPSAPGLQRIADFCAHLHAQQQELRERYGFVPGCPLFNVGGETCQREAVLREAIHRIIRCYTQYLESAIRSGVGDGSIPPCDAPALASLVFAHLEGVLTQARIYDDLTAMARARDGVFRLLSIPVPAQ
ncbi:MAG: TetR/AcrR family transcriptional regulator [Verrucomicrobiales bacterium]|nr:TetR/AcrR family transcriptional regulator [Verrucomicrobiales bacterium]